MKHFIIVLLLGSFFPLWAQNFLVNGDFEQGGPGTGFNFNGQGYVFLPPPYLGTTQPGDIAITTNPMNINPSGFYNRIDHTSGHGNMMVVDGGTIGGGQVFWQAGSNGGGVCGLTSGNSYHFSYWVNSISTSVTGIPTQADIKANFSNALNVQLLNVSSLAPLPNQGWQKYTLAFDATNTCVNIALYDDNVSFNGNEFAIDDIQLMPVGGPLGISVSLSRPSCSDSLSGAVVVYPSGGTPPYSFQLTGPMGTITGPNGLFMGLGAGSYDVTVIDANNQTLSLNNQLLFSNDFLVVNPLDTLVCPNTNVTISVSGGTNTNYIWMAEPADPNLINPVSDTIIVSPNQTTLYTVATNALNVNLIANGNFENGYTGFYTDLNFLTPSNPNGLQTSFGISPNASFWENTFSPCVDHTFGNGIGNMMVVDGAISGNQIVWKQGVAVEKNTQYDLAFFSQTLESNNPAILKFSVNGNNLGIDTLTNVTCTWEQHLGVWNSGNDTIAYVLIENLNQSGIGNDFGIDDIQFSTLRSCTQTSLVEIQQPNGDLGLSYPPYICQNSGLTAPILNPQIPNSGTYSSTPAGLNLDPLSGLINGVGSSPGNYAVVYSVSMCNAMSKDTFWIEVKPLPQLQSLTGGSYNCLTQQFDSVLLFLNANYPVSIQFSYNGTPQQLQGTSNPLSLGTAQGLYVLDSISDLYCNNGLNGTILLDSLSVPALPQLEGNPSVCQYEPPSQFSLNNANPNGTVSWFADSSLTLFLESGNSFYPSSDSTATYYVVQTVDGCIGQVLSFQVTVLPCNLVIPSAFTPNGDGDNDDWEIIGLDAKFPLNQVMVYNRWGELIYTSIEGSYASAPWTGQLDGKPLPVGSYYYIIEKAVDGSIEPINGTVTILKAP